VCANQLACFYIHAVDYRHTTSGLSTSSYANLRATSTVRATLRACCRQRPSGSRFADTIVVQDRTASSRFTCPHAASAGCRAPSSRTCDARTGKGVA
jgi:hypothetical protein